MESSVLTVIFLLWRANVRCEFALPIKVRSPVKVALGILGREEVSTSLAKCDDESLASAGSDGPLCLPLLLVRK